MALALWLGGIAAFVVLCYLGFRWTRRPENRFVRADDAEREPSYDAKEARDRLFLEMGKLGPPPK